MPNMPEHTPAPTPSRAVYGFAAYLCFRTFFILYLIWAVIPEPWFEYIGITCFPQRYWAVALPISIITAILIFGFVIYPSINLCMTPDFNDLRTITDETIQQRKNCEHLSTIEDDIWQKCICKNTKKCGKHEYFNITSNSEEKSIPSVKDLDITEVSRHLYLKFKSC